MGAVPKYYAHRSDLRLDVTYRDTRFLLFLVLFFYFIFIIRNAKVSRQTGYGKRRNRERNVVQVFHNARRVERRFHVDIVCDQQRRPQHNLVVINFEATVQKAIS